MSTTTQSSTASDSPAAGGPAPVAALRQLSDLPGPRGWPVLGNIMQVRPARIHQHIERWCPQYGPMFRLRFGAQRLLVVSDHALINGLMRQRPDGFQRSARLREVGAELGGLPGLFSAEGDAWRAQRRMVMASFAPGHVRAFMPLLVKVALRLQGRWREAARNGRRIDLQNDLKRFTVDVIAGLAFGTEVNTIESGDNQIQQHLDNALGGIFRRTMSPLPYWRWFKLPVDRRMERSMAAVGQAIEGFISQAKARLQADPSRREHPPNLLEAMLVAAEAEGAKLSDLDVAGNVSTMLFAGEDTTANTLAWLIWLLHKHPAALQSAQQEVLEQVPDLARATPQQIEALPYLEACVNEAMRLKPVAPFLVLQALQDCTVGDVQVPRDTLIWCVLRHDSMKEEHFSSPTEFQPERWLGEASNSSSAKRVAMPFGSGPRICPGRYLALHEIKLAMAMLLGSFDILDVTTPDGGPAQEVMHFTMNPVGLGMRLAQREG